MTAVRVVKLHATVPTGWVRVVSLGAFASVVAIAGNSCLKTTLGAPAASVYALLAVTVVLALVASATGASRALLAVKRVAAVSTAFIATESLCRLGHTAVRTWGEGYGDAIWQESLVFIVLIVGTRSLWSLPREPVGSDSHAERHRGDGVGGGDAGYERPRLPRGHIAPVVAVLLLALLRSLGAPPFRGSDAWFQGLPRIAVIPPLASSTGEASTGARWSLGTVTLQEQCQGHFCALTLVTAAASTPRAGLHRSGGSLDLRLDDAHHALVAMDSRGIRAIDRRTGAPINLRAWHLAKGHAPARKWLVAALLGVGVSLLLYAALRRPPRRLRAWRDAEEGTLSETGLLTLSNGDTHALHDPPAAIVGPVLVRGLRRSLDAAPFREALSAQGPLITEGSNATLRAQLAASHDDAVQLAVTLAAAACTPLLVEVLGQIAAR